jgi:hypothetical protein
MRPQTNAVSIFVSAACGHTPSNTRWGTTSTNALADGTTGDFPVGGKLQVSIVIGAVLHAEHGPSSMRALQGVSMESCNLYLSFSSNQLKNIHMLKRAPIPGHTGPCCRPCSTAPAPAPSCTQPHPHPHPPDPRLIPPPSARTPMPTSTLNPAPTHDPKSTVRPHKVCR